MKQLIKSWQLPPSWLRFLIIILLVLGVFFRFVNLEQKVYWDDEAWTSLRISGYTRTELRQQVFTGGVISVGDLQKYQGINPEKGLSDTVKTLAVDDPQHPPLYYTALRLWMQLFGNSVAVTRSLSAVISLLVFPCTYWLCLELFQSPLIGWVAIALLAISPIHVVYAQEAREYSLWTVMILLSSAALLRAMRLKTKLSWTIYASTVALGLYSFLFTGLVIFGHGIYVVATSFRLRKTVTSYLLASLAGLLAFTPWIFVFVSNLSAFEETTNWMTQKWSLPFLFKTWFYNLSLVFSDAQTAIKQPHSLEVIFNILASIFAAITIGYSLYFLCSHAPKRISLFILTLMGVTGSFLIIHDVFLGESMSRMARYAFPCYLGIQLAVAYLLTTHIIYFAGKAWRQELSQIFLVAVLSVGVLSCATSLQAETWWNKLYGNLNYPIAHIINQAVQPLVVSTDYSLGSVLSLSHLLKPNVKLQLVSQTKTFTISDRYSGVFLYDPYMQSRELSSQIAKEQNYKIAPVFKSVHFLWKLTKQ